MLKLVNDRTLVLDTIAGGGVVWVNEARADDVRLASLWRHDSVKAALPRQYRAALINEASEAMMRGNS
jgi:hypothetical protein